MSPRGTPATFAWMGNEAEPAEPSRRLDSPRSTRGHIPIWTNARARLDAMSAEDRERYYRMLEQSRDKPAPRRGHARAILRGTLRLSLAGAAYWFFVFLVPARGWADDIPRVLAAAVLISLTLLFAVLTLWDWLEIRAESRREDAEPFG